ncbi:MAG TPA: ABC transporter ATP-binding protein [Actinomycetota bacterium]
MDALDLTIEPGVLYGFLGPNGAGKTTTIRMMLGLIFPTTGEVDILGEPIFGGTPGQRASAVRRVGAMIEEPAFWKYLSGRKNLEYFARTAGPAADRGRRLGRIDDVIRVAGLDQAMNKKVKAYSQGMRQRLGIALALLGSPELLVLDEPTNGLDPQGMREVRLLLRRLADDGTTVFVSSHLLAEVEAMCDRVGVLARGKLVAEGPPSKLRASSDVVRVEVDDTDRARAILAGVEGVALDGGETSPGTLRLRLAVPTAAAAVNAALVSGGVAVSALVPEHESLEDVFVSLVEGADVPR